MKSPIIEAAWEPLQRAQRIDLDHWRQQLANWRCSLPISRTTSRACRGQPLDNVQRVVSPLVAGGWLTPEKDWNPFSWKVSAGVHAQFSARAQTEAVRRAAFRDIITGEIGHDANTE